MFNAVEKLCSEGDLRACGLAQAATIEQVGRLQYSRVVSQLPAGDAAIRMNA